MNEGRIKINVNDLGFVYYEFISKKLIDENMIRYECSNNTVITVRKSEFYPYNFLIHIVDYEKGNTKSNIYLTVLK